MKSPLVPRGPWPKRSIKYTLVQILQLSGSVTLRLGSIVAYRTIRCWVPAFICDAVMEQRGTTGLIAVVETGINWVPL